MLDEAAETLRGLGQELTGPTAAVDDLLGGRPVLHRTRLAGETRVAVAWPMDAADQDQARRAGVRTKALSLQELVVRTTTAAAGTPPRARSPLADPTPIPNQEVAP